jgi:tetratricopeptide (TPR) repeat protein
VSSPSQVESIFFAALGKKTAAERADYLNDACGGDAELRRRVERLLEAHPQAVDFMARPAVERPLGDALEHEPPPPGPAPTISSDATVNLRQIDECPIVTEVMPPERTPDDLQATVDLKAQPIADSGVTGNFNAQSPQDFGVTGDFTPPTSTGSVIPDRIAPTTDKIPRDEDDIDSNVTASLSATDAAQTAGEIRPAGRSPAKSPARSKPHTPVVPGYEILGTLGQGGMGVVYKARQTGLNRLVALKMIIGGSMAGENQLARFRIEAEAVAQLRHPNIVQIYDIGEVEGMPFVSLEYLDGGDLETRLDGTPQPGIPAALLMATLARAIHVAHQARIVHRDLKPANVLLAGDGAPKITDFGLAKRLESDDNQTQSGAIMGTPSYMAPEQALGQTKDVGPAADIYALGAILYEVLTGRPPLKGETVMETVRLVIHDDPVPPSRLVPRLARDLETICLKCLNKDPQRRYATAEELADDLDRYREGRPIKARPTTVWVRGFKWAKRRPAAALSLAATVLLFIGLIGGVIGYQRYSLNQEVQRNAWVHQQQDRGSGLLELAENARTTVKLENAQVELARFLDEARKEDQLQSISRSIEAKQKWVGEQLAQQRSRAAAEQQNRVDRERFQKFLDRSQEAQLSSTGFGVMNEKDRFEKLGSSAHAALSTYALDPQPTDDAWTLAEPLPAALTDTEKARVADDCYNLLLILSEAAKPAQGLRILDRAVRLRPKTTAAYHRRRADCLERTGDLAGRDRENQEASRTDPVTGLDYFLNGRELVLLRRFADAVRPLNSALQADPENTSAHLLLAVCYLNMQPKSLSQARTSLTTCIRSHRDLVGLYLMRALVAGEEGNQALEKIAQTHPDEAEVARLRQDAKEAIASAEADYGQVLKLKPNDDLQYILLTNRGLMWIQSNRLADAIVDLETAIRLKPSLYPAHASLAQVFQRQGRLNTAAASFERAIACHPEPIVAAGLHRSRALLYAYRSDITPDQRAAAIRDLEAAIRHEPDKVLKVWDHVDRAKLFFAGGEALEALAACDTGLTILADDAPAHRVRISALMELKRYDEVLTSANAFIARGQRSAEIFEIRGLAREGRRQFTAAVADFNEALELTPESAKGPRARLLNLRGMAYYFADAPKLALLDFEESLRLDAKQSEALGGRGLARIRTGDWRPAVTDAEAAARLASAMVPRTEEERKAKAQSLFNAARVYALAVEFAAQEVSRQGERAIALYRNYRGRAMNLLDEALKYAPDQDNRDAILNDPALRSILRGSSRGPAMRFSRLSQDPTPFNPSISDSVPNGRAGGVSPLSSTEKIGRAGGVSPLSAT